MLRRILLAILLTIGLQLDRARADDQLFCGDQKVDADVRIAACNNLLVLNDQDERGKSKILVSRGNAYLRKKDFDRALADFNQAIKGDAANVDAFLQRGNAYWRTFEYDLALADSDEVVRLEPTPEHLLNRALKYVSILQPDKAIADSTQAIALKPELAAAFKCRAFAYSQKKQFDLAIADYDQVLRISPIDRSSMMARRATYDAKGEKLKDAVDYGRMLVARLQVQKSYPRQAAREKSEGTARIFFVISREGELMSSGVGVSSGSAMLDRAALDAVQRAQPFPPLPDGSRESDEFVISLAFRISSLHQLP